MAPTTCPESFIPWARFAALSRVPNPIIDQSAYPDTGIENTAAIHTLFNNLLILSPETFDNF